MGEDERRNIRNGKIRDIISNIILFGVVLGMPVARWE
jgi:hypothetical protein